MNIHQLERAKTAIRYGSQHPDPQLIVLMGLPGSGKSYVADHLHGKYSFTILSGENIAYAIFGTEQCTGEQYQEAYEMLRYLMKELLDQGYSVVVDGTNLKYDHRKQIYDVVGQDIKTLLIYLTIDDTTAFTRANQRGEQYDDPKMITSSVSSETFAGFKEQLEPPTELERFIRITSDENVLQTIGKFVEKFITYGA